MKKGEKSGVVGSMGKGKTAVEKKRKRASQLKRIGIDFDPKTSRIHNQEEVDTYLANYGFRLNIGIKIEFSPHSVNIFLALLNDGVYMHPHVLALGLRLQITRFIRSILTFYRIAPFQL